MNNQSEPEFYVEIFIHSGEIYWADQNTRIRTVLGSCIAISLWHPQLKIGGLSHCLLPENPAGGDNHPLDAKYVRDAVEFFRQEVAKAKTNAKDYRVRLYGGSAFTQFRNKWLDIGKRNTEAAYQYLHEAGFTIASNDTGGRDSRFLIYNLWNGDITVKRSTIPTKQTTGLG